MWWYVYQCYLRMSIIGDGKMFRVKGNGLHFWLMRQILLWCHMTTPKHCPLRKREFYKGQNGDIKGIYLGRTRFFAIIMGLHSWFALTNLRKIHTSLNRTSDFFYLRLACESCQTIIRKYPRNVPYLPRAGDNSTSAVKCRLRKPSALLNGVWTLC